MIDCISWNNIILLTEEGTALSIKYSVNKNARALAALAAAVICAAFLLPAWPVNYLEITTADEAGEVVLAAAVVGGDSFVTTYIHSVQLSPVVDDYRVVGGKLWSWEERVLSHNAGLPFAAPEHGRFIFDPPWMIVQGGRHTFETILHRVGNERFGKNTWRLAPWSEIRIFELRPGKKMAIRASVRALKDARTKKPQGGGSPRPSGTAPKNRLIQRRPPAPSIRTALKKRQSPPAVRDASRVPY